MLNAVFHTTVAGLRDLPADSLAEVAFAGRSNAGKSSAINTLCNHKRLAFVSKLPGRTQLLNFFLADTGRYLVDLPGYGFAKAPKSAQLAWQELIASYMARRGPLAGLVVIMDIRHPLTDLDVMLLDWFKPRAKPVHILLSKADKLSRGQRSATLLSTRKALKEMGIEASVQLFSSLNKEGVEEAEGVVRGWLGLAKKNPAQGEKAG